MKSRVITGTAMVLFLSSMLSITFYVTQATSEQTASSTSIWSFPQPGRFYTLAGRVVVWETVNGKNITSYEEEITKWSVQDVVGDVAFVNRTYVDLYIHPEAGVDYTDTQNFDYQIATNRTILSAYWKWISFTTTGFQGSGERSLDEDLGEHTWAWFPTNLYIGAYVPVSFTGDRWFLGDMLYEVVGEEVIQIVGEKQDCWMLRMPPSITIDGLRVRMETYWVDKDTGVPLKIYGKAWALDGSSGFAYEDVLVNTNIELGPESSQTLSPTYTLTVLSTSGFPVAGKFYTWYYLDEGWYIDDTINVTWYADALFSWWVVNITDDEALIHRIMWYDRVCEAEGVEELEAVEILYFSYRVSITTREIQDATGSSYVVNMSSLTYVGPENLTPLLAGDVGEETYCWLPTNLYLGAAVNVSWTFDRLWKLDNATYIVIDEEIVSDLWEPQACWVLYLPSTLSIDGTWNYSETFYSDKDVGIPLVYIGEGCAVDGSSVNKYALQLIDTNVDLGPRTDVFPIVAYSQTRPRTLNLKSKGEWITAYSELSEGYDVNDINVSTIVLNDTIPAEIRPVAIGDYDGDGISDLMVKFERQAVIDLILRNYQFTDRSGIVTLTVTGKLNDGTPFQGSDIIRITMSMHVTRKTLITQNPKS